MTSTRTLVAEVLESVRKGDQDALENLATLCYRELQFHADRIMRTSGAGVTLQQPTGLVHEAWIRCTPEQMKSWQTPGTLLQRHGSGHEARRA